MSELIKINPDGRTTSKELYEFLELNSANYSRWCKINLLDNEFAETGIDYFPFIMNDECGGQATTNYYLTIPFAKKLCMMSRSDRGNQAREYFIEVERQFKAGAKQLTQIQMLAAMAQQMADQEQIMLAASANASTALRQIDYIKDTIVRRDDDNWREGMNLELNRIVKGSGRSFQDIKSESYELLEDRAGCKLSVRVNNARDRLAESGATKTKISAFCKLDAIEQEPRLREIYTSIVKEMAIREMR